MEKKFTSVEELDAYLETLTADDVEDTEAGDSTGIETETALESVVETEEEETIEAEESEEEEVLEEQEDEETVIEDVPKKETKEEKQERQRNYTVGKLRKEATEAKHRAQELEQEASDLRALTSRLMKEGGYSDFTEFKNAVETQLSEKEMKEKGLTKEQYSEIERLRVENQQLNARLNQTENVTKLEKAKKFDGVVGEYAEKAKTTRKEIYDTLQSKGYTTEMLLSQPDPELLIKGVLADKLTVVRTVVKKQVDTQKLTSGGNAKTDTVDLDELVKQDLKDYMVRKGNA